MGFRDDQKFQIQQATDIVRLIGDQVALRPKGKEFVGLCPFHDDKNPSMYVSPQKQIFHCFVCGSGGDAYGWMMNYHKMSFPEALRYLAEQAGIEIRDTDRASRVSGEKRDDRLKILAANQLAVGFFQAMLRHTEHGRVARRYLEQRGISDDVVEQFQLGVAPDRWDGLATTIAAKGWDTESFCLAGLISPREKSPEPETRARRPETQSHYDRLRHRLVFPICDAIGRPMAFGGRILPDSSRDDAAEAKYLNSPETAIFNKSATLYGIHLAKKPIIDSQVAVIVEGYTDVTACHQGGARNVVATLGTALTAEHVQQLRKYAEKVVLVFDADEAGQKASDRAVELFLTGDLDVAIALLPSGEDPDSLLRRDEGLERWRSIVDQAADALSYLFDRMQQELDAAHTITGRQKLVEAYLSRLAQLGLARTGSIRRALVVARLAELVGIGENEILQTLKARAPRAAQERGDAPSEQSPGRLQAVALAERQVIGGLIQQNELFHHPLADGRGLDEALTPGDFVTAENRDLYASIYDRLSEGLPVELAAFMGELARDEKVNLSAIVVGADADLEQATLGRAGHAAQVVTAAAESILQYAEHRQYQRKRRQVDAPIEAQRLVEHQRANPSPVKIMRAASEVRTPN